MQAVFVLETAGLVSTGGGGRSLPRALVRNGDQARDKDGGQRLRGIREPSRRTMSSSASHASEEGSPHYYCSLPRGFF